jgi:hypothetical protein
VQEKINECLWNAKSSPTLSNTFTNVSVACPDLKTIKPKQCKNSVKKNEDQSYMTTPGDNNWNVLGAL